MTILVPLNEDERLEALRSYEILDTPPDQALDDITQLAAQICHAPMALVTLVDAERQWFKSKTGLLIDETERRFSFCSHAILDPGNVMIVPDALADERFSSNPLVLGEPNIRFYVGLPLITAEGYALGTLCVMDNIPREITADEMATLHALRRSVNSQLSLQRSEKELKSVNATLAKLNADLDAKVERRTRESTEALLELRAQSADRALAQASVHESEERFRTLWETTNDAVLITGEDSVIRYANPAVQRVFGYAPEELTGQSMSILQPKRLRHGHERGMANYIATGEKRLDWRAVKTHALRRDGSEFPVEVAFSSPVLGGEQMFVGFLRDISDRITAEAAKAELETQLHEAQKMEALGTLSSGIAHDFNNILGAILGNVTLASEVVGESHAASESLDQIAKAGLRAKSLVEQILTFTRKQTTELTNQPLQPVLDETVRLLRAMVPASAHLQLAMAAAPVHARVNASQLSQVLINLVTNAWHALENRAGQIILSLDEVELDHAQGHDGSALLPGRYARIRVRDDGSGMDAATQARMFEPFFTTKPVGTGTGLGLSVVLGIVKSHHGDITVSSAPGEGSIFDVLLPVSNSVESVALPALPPLARPALSTVQRGVGQHIVYLDDDEPMLFLMKRLLVKRGFRVSGFLLAEEMLATVRANPKDFDVVVTDFNMPKASGLEVARKIAQILPELPVVIISGYIDERLRDGAREAGVRHLVYKQNSNEELVETLCRLLERPTSPPEKLP